MMTPKAQPVRESIEMRVDQGDGLQTAATVFLPAKLAEQLIVWFAFPGGGGTRHAFFMSFPGKEDYSQADYFARNGMVFVACDHLGVGGSTPLPSLPISWEQASAANQRTATAILERMVTGTLAEGLEAFQPAFTVGTGHSMGGMLMCHQQGTYGTFDAVAIVGASAIQTRPPAVREGRDQATWAFHGSEPADLLQMATSAGGERAPVIIDPAQLMSLKPVAAEAAAIDVPVLVGVGELDVVPDLWAEPLAYASSPHVTVTVVERMGHAYHFANTRHILWSRLRAWSASLLDAKLGGG
jgi:alpha-beta hydrolase superfamily lysophospholipase